MALLSYVQAFLVDTFPLSFDFFTDTPSWNRFNIYKIFLQKSTVPYKPIHTILTMNTPPPNKFWILCKVYITCVVSTAMLLAALLKTWSHQWNVNSSPALCPTCNSKKGHSNPFPFSFFFYPSFFFSSLEENTK